MFAHSFSAESFYRHASAPRGCAPLSCFTGTLHTLTRHLPRLWRGFFLTCTTTRIATTTSHLLPPLRSPVHTPYSHSALPFTRGTARLAAYATGTTTSAYLFFFRIATPPWLPLPAHTSCYTHTRSPLHTRWTSQQRFRSYQHSVRAGKSRTHTHTLYTAFTHRQSFYMHVVELSRAGDSTWAQALQVGVTPACTHAHTCYGLVRRHTLPLCTPLRRATFHKSYLFTSPRHLTARGFTTTHHARTCTAVSWWGGA